MQAFFDIDTQIDFVFPAGALYAPGAERVIPAVTKLNRAGPHVISTMCAHPENAAEFKVWPPHCVVGTVGQQKPAATRSGQIIVEKNALDPFSNPSMDDLLKDLGIDECYVYGVLLEYCVQHALMGLLKRGRNVWLVTDATTHLSEQAGRKVIDDFLAAGGRLIESSQIPIRFAS